jgi:hypothetical protein
MQSLTKLTKAMTTKIIGIIRDVLFFVVFILLIVCCNRCNSLRSDKLKLDVDLKAMQDSVHHYKLADGSNVAERRSLEMDIQQYKKQVLTTHAERKQLVKRIGRLNNLTSELEVKLQAKQIVQVPVHDTVLVERHDTVHAGTFFYEDRYLLLKGLLHNDSCDIDYRFHAGLSIAAYYKKDGLLKASYPVINVLSDNPHLSVSGMDSYVIQHKVHFYETKGFCFGAGLVAGVLLSHL